MNTTGELSINIDAVARNWQLLDERTTPAECGAVVKADAYGLGVKPIVKALLAVGCQTFFVATIEEAVQLRDSFGFAFDIVIFGGQAANDYKGCVEYQLTPVLVAKDQVYSWLDGQAKRDSRIKSIIKLDTGMHRFGISTNELSQLVDGDQLIELQPSYLMSHLACADVACHPQNKQQLDCFSQALSLLKRQLPNCRATLANSSACYLDSTYHFDLCRPGIALYGGAPAPTFPNPMSSVVELYLPIMQIKTINAGDAVGYGAQFIAPHSMQIALVFGGYADGLFRALCGKGKGFVGGHEVPMVGRVSMDALAFNVSAVPADVLSTTPKIELLGSNQSIDQLAAQAETISYEVLTSLGSRYHRQYITEP